MSEGFAKSARIIYLSVSADMLRRLAGSKSGSSDGVDWIGDISIKLVVVLL